MREGERERGREGETEREGERERGEVGEIVVCGHSSLTNIVQLSKIFIHYGLKVRERKRDGGRERERKGGRGEEVNEGEERECSSTHSPWGAVLPGSPRCARGRSVRRRYR